MVIMKLFFFYTSCYNIDRRDQLCRPSCYIVMPILRSYLHVTDCYGLSNNMYRECLHRNTIYYTSLVEVVPLGLHWLQRGGAIWRVMVFG